MRILVHEFASGGGFAGRDVPAGLLREGAAIRSALIADLVALNCHAIVTTADARFPLPAGAGAEVHIVYQRREHEASAERLLNHLIASADAVWLVAPETNGCLERMARLVERHGKPLLGSGAVAIRRASDKAGLGRRLARCGVPCPETRVVRRAVDAAGGARALGYPVVLKPGLGAGCTGVCLAHNARELGEAIDDTRSAGERGSLVVQRFVQGTAASVSVLSDGRRSVALSLNGQSVRTGRRFSYHGGCTPLDHPIAQRAIDVSLRACRALPGLRGYVGVDLVLTRSEAFVIEVNPRLTTAYLGLRAALGDSSRDDANVAGMAIAACGGNLPEAPSIRRRVRFTSAGCVESVR